ncbi:MAG: glycosyltransferase [Hyphomicrobium sp.]|nr:glycosyltransferase [Hyphomicrobium sp.]
MVSVGVDDYRRKKAADVDRFGGLVFVTDRIEIDSPPLIAAHDCHFKAAPAEMLDALPPHLSAHGPLVLWQRLALLLVVTTLSATLLMHGLEVLLLVVTAALGPVFLCIIVIRWAALAHLSAASTQPSTPSPIGDADPKANGGWPFYSIIVPLYREAGVVDELLAALAAIDYPADRREVLFAIEAGDYETAAALARAVLPPGFRVLTLERSNPQTKPHALMRALAYARGTYVVVYDAEDLPEPDQLRRAVAAFRSGGPRLGCLQARLNIYNRNANWLTRQFALEYTALFDAILPALKSFALPVPLGGTSNHFPRDVLIAVGGWDPYNVTEDADLGIRLLRSGFQVDMLPSTTWEEAPPRLSIWMGQRIRWLKGWMQTFLVHTRNPARTCREMGIWPFLGLNVLMGGVIVSALVHPWAYVAALWVTATNGTFLAPPADNVSLVLWLVGLSNLLAAYAVSIALSLLAAKRRGFSDLFATAWTLPIYWLLISAAAYRALIELVVAPQRWRKTAHAPGRHFPVEQQAPSAS